MDPEELAEFSGCPSGCPQDQGTAWDAALASIMGEKDSQTFIDEQETRSLSRISLEQNAGKASTFAACSFPEKLWVLVESYL